MSDEFNDDDDYEDLDESGKAALRRLRSTAKSQSKELEELRSKVEELSPAARKLAFLEAGITTEKLADPRVSDFVKAYDGPMEATAIREAATARQFIDPPKPDPGVQAHNEANAATAGASGVSPDENAQAEYEAAMAKATSQADVLGIARAHGSEVDSIIR